ncbi:MAG: hypothetical protein AAF721_21895 [Myxococcota bacterium]
MWGVTPAAYACSDDGFGEVSVSGGELVTTPDGVMSVSVWADGISVEQDGLTMSVVQGTTAVEGELSFVPFSTARGGMLVFRPDTPMEVGDFYTFTVTAPNSFSGPTTGSFEVVEGSLDQDLSLGLSGARMSLLKEMGTGPRICCDYVDTIDTCGSTQACTTTEWADSLLLSADLDDSRPLYFSDPAFSSTYAEVFFGTDGEADALLQAGRPWSLDSGNDVLSARFDESADEYCLRVDVVSLVDGARHSVMACADDDGTELQTGPADLDSFLDACEGAPYWAEDGEPFETGEDDALAGCSCRSRGPGHAWLATLLLGLLVARRRRS